MKVTALFVAALAAALVGTFTWQSGAEAAGDCDTHVCVATSGNQVTVTNRSGRAHKIRVHALSDTTKDRQNISVVRRASDCDDRSDGNTDDLLCLTTTTYTHTERNCEKDPSRCRFATQRRWGGQLDYECRGDAASAGPNDSSEVAQEWVRTYWREHWEPGYQDPDPNTPDKERMEYTTTYRSVEITNYVNDGTAFGYPDVKIIVTYKARGRNRQYPSTDWYDWNSGLHFAPVC